MLCPIGWVSHGVLFDGLEMEERKLSVSRNGGLSGYIYGRMDFLPFGPTYFSAFLFGRSQNKF